MTYTIKLMMGHFYGVFDGDDQIAMFKHQEHAEWFIKYLSERKHDD